MINGVGMPAIGAANCANTSECIAPRKKDNTREIIKEELEKQKKLDKLEEKYNAGEISKFEYTVSKAMLTMKLPKAEPKFVAVA